MDQTNKKLSQAITYYLGVIAVGLVVGLSIQFARAWTEPAAAPPGGNVGAPLNTSDIHQNKGAGLTLNQNGIDITGLTVNGNAVIQNGKVGIGTTSLSSQLNVKGPEVANTPQLLIESSLNSAQIGMSSTANSHSGFLLQEAGTPKWYFAHRGDIDDSFRIYDYDKGDYVFTINSSGNVGIGTTRPQGKVHVVTSNDALGGIGATWDDKYFVIGANGATGGVGISFSQTSNVGVIQAASPDVAYRNLLLQPASGNVGIGTTNPGEKLEINGGVQLNTATAKPTCDLTKRGTFWVTQGSTGVKDAVEVCAKNASNVYGWRPLW